MSELFETEAGPVRLASFEASPVRPSPFDASPEEKRNNDFCRNFTGDRCINVTHFYSIGFDETVIDQEWFAFGYWTHDGLYRTGVVAFEDGSFGKEHHVNKWCT